MLLASAIAWNGYESQAAVNYRGVVVGTRTGDTGAGVTGATRTVELCTPGLLPTAFVAIGTVTGGKPMSVTPSALVVMRAPGGRLIATGSTGRILVLMRLLPETGIPPTETGAPTPKFVMIGCGKVLAGGKPNVGCGAAELTTVSVGGPPMVERSNVRPATCGGVAVIPPGLTGAAGVTVPGVTTAELDGALAPRTGAAGAIPGPAEIAPPPPRAAWPKAGENSVADKTAETVTVTRTTFINFSLEEKSA